MAADLITLVSDIEAFEAANPDAGYDEPEMLALRRRVRGIASRLAQFSSEYLGAFRCRVQSCALLRSYAMRLLVPPASLSAAHTGVLLVFRDGRPALQAVDLIEQYLALRVPLLSVHPIFAVVGACPFMAPKARLILDHQALVSSAVRTYPTKAVKGHGTTERVASSRRGAHAPRRPIAAALRSQSQRA